MAKLTLTDITSGYALTTTVNANNALIEAALENTLSRDGTGPNTMSANLDMNSNRITNLPNAVNNSEPVTFGQAASIAGVTNPLTQAAVGAVLYPQTAAESGAGVTPTDYAYPEGHLSRYGPTGDGATDDTAAFTSMLSFSGWKYVPKPTSKYKIDQLDIGIGDWHLWMEPGTIIEANTGYGTSDQVFDIGDPNDVENISIIGNGSTIQMLKSEYTTGENRHCIRLTRATNVFIEGLTLKDSGGDGLYIGAGDTYCENVTVRNCVMDNNRRQGISIVSGINILIDNCYMKNTTGTSPQAGIDIEWNADAVVTTEGDGPMENIVVQNCISEGNTGPNFKVAIAGLTTPAATEFDVKFINCTSIGGSDQGFECSGGKDANRQNVAFINCSAYDSNSNGFSFKQCGADKKMIGCSVYNPNQGSNANNRDGSAVSLFEASGGRDGDNYGNLFIDGLKVEDIDGNMNQCLTLRIVTESASTIKDVYARIIADGIDTTKRTANVGALRGGYIDIEYLDRPVNEPTGSVTSGNMAQYANTLLKVDTGNFNITHSSDELLGVWYDFEIDGTTGTVAIIAGAGNEIMPYNATTIRSTDPGSKIRVRFDGTNWQAENVVGGWARAIPALADSATPSVSQGNVFLTGGTTAITDITGGYEGKIITIIAEHSITITDGTNIFLNGSANFAMTATDTLTLIQKADGNWYEISRGDNGA